MAPLRLRFGARPRKFTIFHDRRLLSVYFLGNNPIKRGRLYDVHFVYSTVTDFARFLGLSTSQPRVMAA